MKHAWIPAALCGLGLTLGAAERLLIEDFSDVGTWRSNPVRNTTPGKWFGADVYLGATPDASRDDGYAGKLLFHFADASKAGQVDFLRAKAGQPEVFADGVEFDINPRGISGSLRFTLEDSQGKRFMTSPAEFSGEGWRRCRAEVGKAAEGFTGPFKLYKIHFEAKGVSGSNYVLVDDFALTGDVSRRRTVSIRPVVSSLATEPGKPGKASYRFRSASAKALEGKVVYRLFDWDGKELLNRSFPVSLKPYGSTVLDVALPPLGIGSYNASLEFTSGKIKSDYTDWIAVFHPNNGRKNDHPMWFGVQDTSIWNGEAENELHYEWMKMAGFDIERLGITGNRLDNGKTTNFEGYEKVLKGNRDAGMIACASYTEGVPDYTQEKPLWRGMPTKPDAFRGHMDKVFRCLAKYPNVQYLEFWNEPDIGFMVGTLDQYLDALKIVRASQQANAPKLKIATGGVTVIHPKEKKNFSRDMYWKGKGLYDVACFHAHGSLRDYSERQELLEKWLEEGGIDLPVCNTETGDRSGYTVDTIKRHAVTLVKKIVYAKSRNTEFYAWFTLQDYWDMDFEADDSFGLVTSDNRPKPSFIAYNELIRQLGNTGRGELLSGTCALEVYRFVNDREKREVLAIWPKVGGTRQVLPLEGEGEVKAAGLFGAVLPVEAGHGYAAIPVDGPVYVSYPQGAFRIASAVAEQKQVTGTSAGRTVNLPLMVRNPFSVAATVTVGGASPIEVKAGESREIPVPVAVPADQPNGIFSAERTVVLTAGKETLRLTVPLAVNVGYPVAAGTKAAAHIVLNTLDRVHELSFDPAIPRWKGPEDLSCDFAMTRVGSDLKLNIRVADDRHVMNAKPAETWLDDSIQIGFQSLDGAFTELALAGRNGKGEVYAQISPDPSLRGAWDVPAKVTRQGNVTVYDITLPLAKLKISDKPGTLFRFSFLVNENDGQGRVRWIEWMGGIGRSKNPDEFGWGVML